MCTAITYPAHDFYFGRNLDLERGYGEQVCITPRNFPLHFRKMPSLPGHHAMIGMATVMDGYPLYYEATNELGLSMAGLNFPGSAQYLPEQPGKDNVTPFEFIPWILSQCGCVSEAEKLLKKLNLVDIPFSAQLPLSPLHWIIADRERAIVAEPVADGIRVFENPVGVLTNEPGFDFHMYHLANFMNLTALPATDRFTPEKILKSYCTGMGAIGLPGDWSSTSRFVRAAFVKLNAPAELAEASSVTQFFHMLSAVAMPKGAVKLDSGQSDITRYSSCCNADKGIYYYTTYENRRITGVDMHKADLSGSQPICYPLCTQPQILMNDQEKDGQRL